MRKRLLLFSAALFLAAPARAGFVDVLTLDGEAINPVTSEYIEKGIARAERAGAECVILNLDTPGGLVETTRRIVKKIMNAAVPVVVYVAPPGSHAASAGTYITLAADIAAMAPSTSIGAATPVSMQQESGMEKLAREIARALKKKEKGEKEGAGKGEKEEKEKKEEEGEETDDPRDAMRRKIVNDAVSWIKTICEVRGRNVLWAEEAVRKGVTATANEALEENVVDVVSENLDDLLQQINGRKVQVVSGERTLRTEGATVRRMPPGLRLRFLYVITNPNVAWILMMLGIYGLFFEFTHPGIGFPGIAGAICIILAFYAFQALPVNYAGLFLILLAIVLFIAEAMVTSFGLLALGGIVSMILGSIMLIDSPYAFMRISLGVVLPITFTTAVIVVLLVSAALRARREKVFTGSEGMIGERGRASSRLDPEGSIEVHGEIWRARAKTLVEKGEAVEVTGVEGLLLHVRKVS